MLLMLAALLLVVLVLFASVFYFVEPATFDSIPQVLRARFHVLLLLLLLGCLSGHAGISAAVARVPERTCWAAAEAGHENGERGCECILPAGHILCANHLYDNGLRRCHAQNAMGQVRAPLSAAVRPHSRETQPARPAQRPFLAPFSAVLAPRLEIHPRPQSRPLPRRLDTA